MEGAVGGRNSDLKKSQGRGKAPSSLPRLPTWPPSKSHGIPALAGGWVPLLRDQLPRAGSAPLRLEDHSRANWLVVGGTDRSVVYSCEGFTVYRYQCYPCLCRSRLPISEQEPPGDPPHQPLCRVPGGGGGERTEAASPVFIGGPGSRSVPRIRTSICWVPLGWALWEALPRILRSWCVSCLPSGGATEQQAPGPELRLLGEGGP